MSSHMLIIIGFMITATTGLPDHEQGLGTAQLMNARRHERR
ncbi:hypothetical protein [Micromonospora arborensis]